jgi:protease I
MQDLANKKIAYLVEENFEDLEFWAVSMYLQAEGAQVTIASPKPGAIYKSKSGGLSAQSELAAEAIDPQTIDAVIVPGGWAPDKLRRYDSVKNLVRRAYENGKVIGMICHAGWVGVSADIVRGHNATGSIAIKDDLANAGATWRDEAAFISRVDGKTIVWGRVVPDIPAFCYQLKLALTQA